MANGAFINFNDTVVSCGNNRILFGFKKVFASQKCKYTESVLFNIVSLYFCDSELL
jgi:hypothetical protein